MAKNVKFKIKLAIDGKEHIIMAETKLATILRQRMSATDTEIESIKEIRKCTTEIGCHIQKQVKYSIHKDGAVKK